MIWCLKNSKRGTTIVELMVTIVIVAILAATLGTFVVKLLTIQELERDEAYVRERLVEICGAYADYLSIGSTVSNSVNGFGVAYRTETGGVSFETGCVSRVTQLNSFEKDYALVKRSWKSLNMNIYTSNATGEISAVSREFSGADLPLIPLSEFKISGNEVNLTCELVPLNTTQDAAALWNLQVEAQYKIKNDNGELVDKCVLAERVIRLWNRE